MRFLAIKSDRNGSIYSTSLANLYRCLSHSFESLSLSHTSLRRKHISPLCIFLLKTLKTHLPILSRVSDSQISHMDKFHSENVSGKKCRRENCCIALLSSLGECKLRLQLKFLEIKAVIKVQSHLQFTLEPSSNRKLL